MDGKYAGVIGVGGLLLARIPEELAQSRVDYQKRQTEGQDEAVENDLLKDQDQTNADEIRAFKQKLRWY